jgi:uncharacterized protein YkwD
LTEAAEELLREAKPLPPPSSMLRETLLRAGVPHPAPQIWWLEGSKLTRAKIVERAEKWLASIPQAGRRRCGLARTRTAQGKDRVVALMVDALAELGPLPTQARFGAWLTVDSQLLVPASDARVVVLPPDGRPLLPLTSFDGGRVRAKIALGQTGRWTFQVLATLEQGPVAAADAVVFVDTEPTNLLTNSEASIGETPSASTSPEAYLYALLNDARTAAHVNLLQRDSRLDEVAREHALNMMRAGKLRHFLGGTPEERLRDHSIDSVGAGENVVFAADLQRAHHTLLASPSHRANMLDQRYDYVGIGVAADPKGGFWACELFTDFDEVVNSHPHR